VSRRSSLVCAFCAVGMLALPSLARGGGYQYALIGQPSLLGTPLAFSVSMNGQGVVAFIALQSGFMTVLRGSGGALATVAVDDPDAGDTIGAATSIDEALAVAFAGTTAGVAGVYVAEAGAAPVALYDAGGPLKAFGDPALNGAGEVVFRATDDLDRTRIAIGDGSAPAATIADETLGTLGIPVSLNSSGATAFTVTTAGGVTQVVRGSRSGITPIADDGETSGLCCISGSPTVDDAGVVAFAARRDAGIGPPAAAILEGSGGGLAIVVDELGPFQALTRPIINAAGRVAFLGTLDSGEQGIWTGANPVKDKVIQTGDTLFGLPVTSVLLGGFNAGGQVAFGATLDDGSLLGKSVVVRADPTPEPASGAAALAAAAALASVRRIRASGTPR